MKKMGNVEDKLGSVGWRRAKWWWPSRLLLSTMVRDTWYMEYHGTGYIVPGSSYLARGTWYLVVHDTWYLEHHGTGIS